MIGGTLFRIGIGAMPFLLPLMLQLGFGLTPFQSGMITFVSAIGAIAMKFLAPCHLQARRLPQRAVHGGRCVAAASSPSTACSRPTTPVALIIAVLLVGGFCRSILLHRRSTRWCSPISSDKDASQATAITAVSQQISVALGVAIAGGVLEAFTLHHRRAARPPGLHWRFRDRGDHRVLASCRSCAVARCRHRCPATGRFVQEIGKLEPAPETAAQS